MLWNRTQGFARVAALAALGFAAGPAPAQIAPAYLVTGLTGATGPSQALGVSPNGQFITGYSTVGAAQQAYRYNTQTQTLTSLGTLAGTTNSQGNAVNNTGTVAGFSTNASLLNTPDFAVSDRAFIATGNTPAAVAILTGNGFSGQPFDGNRATGVNNANLVVGSAYNIANGDFQPFTSAGGATPTKLNFLGPAAPLQAGTLALANGVNTAGVVVGEGDRETGTAVFNPSFAIRYPAGSTTPADLPHPAGFQSSHGFAINDAGNVAGFTETLDAAGNPVLTRGYFYNGTTATALGILTGGTASFGNAINNNNTVVGDADSAAGSRAVIYNGATPIDLNTLLTGANAGSWTLQAAWGIADNGLIVGYGLIGGQQRAFMLTPVPEPGTLALCGAAAAVGGFGTWRRRKRA